MLDIFYEDLKPIATLCCKWICNCLDIL